MTQKNVKHILGTGEEQSFVRLYADEGKALTNDGGKTVWNCVDVDSADGWTEIDAPIEYADEYTEESALTQYANSLTGASDQTLIEAAETLIEQKIKETVE